MLSSIRLRCSASYGLRSYHLTNMRAFDELRKLEIFFMEETRRGCSVIELYELVQHAGNILPRLYLLCTAGSVYIKTKEAPAKEILKDLVEMCRGIQHPLRGLFLRSYLAQIGRDKLPDVGSEYEGDADTVTDAVEFVLLNFTEMNKLWVRMQHQGPARDKERREKERGELRDLVGKNLHVLSQLEGVDLDMYRDTVLPRVLEQIVNCRDEIAQYYLIDCIIQVFPDEYHLQTLDVLLGACPQLQPSVDIMTVLSRLMERLSNYAALNAEVLPYFLQVEAFSKLNNAIGKVIEAQEDMPILSAVTLYSSLLKFTLHVHPDRLDYADQVLGSCVKQLSGKGKINDTRATKEIVSLLSAPLEKYNDVVTALKLTNYPLVVEYLDNETKRIMATVIIRSIMKNNTLITTAEKVEALLELIKGLINDLDEPEGLEAVDDDDFEEEQNSVARLVHMLYNDDTEEMFKIISILKKHFLTGGPKRLKFTIPPLVVSTLKLIRRLPVEGDNPFGKEASVTATKIFQFLNQIIEALPNVPSPDLAFRLYLQCAEAANKCVEEPIAYEFFTQAYILYEEEISDSKAQVTALQLIIGTLQRMHVFGVENRDTLTHKATGYSAKLLKKPDQCRAVYACSHLFWLEDHETIQDGERVLLCLKRALKIANSAQQMASNGQEGSAGSVTLFIEILNKYLYFYEKGIPQITVESVESLIQLIKNEESMPSDPYAESLFASTLQFMEFQKQKGGAIGDRYEEIKV
ncbi:PREDICTED: vacuolar protein sorting-associated protein 35A isoform X2 [Camelina sativa]|uniref:Vacuolar protein sorting-associated protein 35 n=1 Tax=Camelina sativa TaxID=90675 RepID=A0ABM0SMM9_CAMSA|nr:PREDICTED: vacuolar protein sorting-associated protein 35A isoform X2 [Camelina sativa]